MNCRWDSLYGEWLLDKIKSDNNKISYFGKNLKRAKKFMIHAMNVAGQVRWHEEGILER